MKDIPYGILLGYCDSTDILTERGGIITSRVLRRVKRRDKDRIVANSAHFIPNVEGFGG